MIKNKNKQGTNFSIGNNCYTYGYAYAEMGFYEEASALFEQSLKNRLGLRKM